MRSITRGRTIRPLLGIAAAAALLAACSGAPAPDGSSTSAPTSGFTVDTPKPTKDAGDVVWAAYHEVQTLDPIYAFDLPEAAGLSAMCDSLLRMNNDMSYGNGLGTMTQPSDTEYDFAINAGAKFWDGSAVTADDVVFSLERQRDKTLGGFYGAVFDRVKTIEAVDASTVKITLTQPDYWLPGELSSTPGKIIQKKFATAAGQAYGTPSGGIMCSGVMKLESWQTGDGVKMVPNTAYWDSSLPKPKLTTLTLTGVPDDAALTAGLETGAIDGSYLFALSTLGRLQSSDSVKVFQGAPFQSNSMAIMATQGPLADPKVRQAVSLAIDRKGLLATLLRGAGNLPHAMVGSGTWGTAQDVFKAGYDALPALEQDVAKAKELAKTLGIEGKTVRVGTSTGIPSASTTALAFKAACEAIGLKVELVDSSPTNFVNFFIDPKAIASIDAVPTANYGDYADPSALYKTIVLPGGSQNYTGYDDPAVTSALNAARSEKDETKRAQDVVIAQKVITDELVWIPLLVPNNVLVMNKGITGAPATFVYAYGPWPAYLGGA